MSTSPSKHKSSHHHHHHHRDHHHATSATNIPSAVAKPPLNLSTFIKIQDNSKLLPRYSVGKSKLKQMLNLN